MGQLDNKVAIVTGAAGGLGRATSLAMLKEGARLVMADIDDEAGQAQEQEFRQMGYETAYQRADVGVSADVEKLVEGAATRYGRLDVMVNNAAVAISGSAVDITEEKWQQVLNVNLSSVWRGMKYAIPHMLESGGGSIVNISSAQSLIGFKGWSAYAAAKGGINALTRQAAVDYSPHNIRINAIAPGTIMTPMNERIFAEMDDPQPLIDHWTNLITMGRFGQPDEVAALVVFLGSDASSFITGEIIRIDGGQVINGG